jgi:nucleotide-binding universal stress UspA family protein
MTPPPEGRTVLVQRNRRLMVGLSRTAADAALLSYAAMLARLGTLREARFVHVLPAAGAAHGHDRVLAELQADVQQHFAKVPEDVAVFCDVLKGPLLDRLLAFVTEQESDLLLLGHARAHPQRGALARRLATKAPCSVWMVPESSPPRIARILVPTDFSEHSADTILVATSLAELLGHTEILALHVYFNEARVTYEEYDQVIRGQERELFDRFLAPINCHGVSVQPLFEEGADVAHVINRVAEREKADLIVMATRGRSRSAAILLGSVTEETIAATQVPLLVVKHFGARIGVVQALLDRSFRRQRGTQFD